MCELTVYFFPIYFPLDILYYTQYNAAKVEIWQTLNCSKMLSLNCGAA